MKYQIVSRDKRILKVDSSSMVLSGNIERKYAIVKKKWIFNQIIPFIETKYMHLDFSGRIYWYTYPEYAFRTFEGARKVLNQLLKENETRETTNIVTTA